MAKTNVYVASGFLLLNQIATAGTRVFTAAIVNIAKGDALHDDAAGLATNATTAFANTFLGFAAAAVDNSGDDSLTVNVIPYLSQYQFIVPCANDGVLEQTDVGTIVDLEAAGTIDTSDAVTTGPGFFIDEVDISTAAIAANTYGYAIGHMVNIAAVT